MCSVVIAVGRRRLGHVGAASPQAEGKAVVAGIPPSSDNFPDWSTPQFRLLEY
ncbi:MAG TPA: hypothetical protein VJA46_13560 [Acidimicrobiia bacterium]|nr:hypothetical protein [Acidimicrobiia bacterium]